MRKPPSCGESPCAGHEEGLGSERRGGTSPATFLACGGSGCGKPLDRLYGVRCRTSRVQEGMMSSIDGAAGHPTTFYRYARKDPSRTAVLDPRGRTTTY